MVSTPESRATAMLCAQWVPFPFATLFLAARFYVRGLRRTYGLDDWVMLLAYLFMIADEALTTHGVLLGGFDHIKDISPSRLSTLLYFDAIGEELTIITLALEKTAVALLLLRIIGKTHRVLKWIITVNITLYNLISVVGCVLCWVVCNPSKARWHPELVAERLATCSLTQVHVDWTILIGSFGAYIDFTLALLPILVVYNLQISLKKKFGICILLGLGLFAGICSIIKTLEFNSAYNSPDPTYGGFGLQLWTSLELKFIVIAGCVPPANPLFDSIFRRRPIVEGSQPLGISLGFMSLGSWGSKRNLQGSSNSGENRQVVPSTAASDENVQKVQQNSLDEDSKLPVFKQQGQ